MSTYLVAFLVGDFQCTTGAADGVPIRVCGTPDKLKFTHFALEAAEYILPYYDKYFGIKYPMPKLDLIGLPDFEAGAMENFGCITYRETDLLIDPNASLDAKKNVASVVAHEMAHQWFGDMVTMQWWDNLWLNEGFATWMSNKPITAWHPEWNFPQDAATSLDATLNLDAQPTTHAIRARETETPDQINELFDGISYGKGAAVIGMVENYLGEETFRQGVHNYLAAHLYANATAEDFWNAQTANSHKPADTIMASFIDQPGVPLLTFTNAVANVSQSRFFLSPPKPDQRTATFESPGWTIPVCLKASGGTQTCPLLTPHPDRPPPNPHRPHCSTRTQVTTATTAPPTPPPNSEAITTSAETLIPTERVGLLGDEYALVRSGQQPIASILDLILALKRDPDASVLKSALTKLDSIQTQIATPEDSDRIDALVVREFDPVYKSLGKAKKERALQHSRAPQLPLPVPRSLRRPRHPHRRRPPHREGLRRQTRRQPRPDRRRRLRLLPQRRRRPLRQASTRSRKCHRPRPQIRRPPHPRPLPVAHPRHPYPRLRRLRQGPQPGLLDRSSPSFSRIPKTREITWQYIQQHWEAVHAQFTTNSGVRVVAAAGTFCTVQGRDEVQSFFATHHVDASERTLAKSIDSINDCIRRRAIQQPNLHTWLSTH